MSEWYEPEPPAPGYGPPGRADDGEPYLPGPGFAASPPGAARGWPGPAAGWPAGMTLGSPRTGSESAPTRAPPPTRHCPPRPGGAAGARPAAAQACWRPRPRSWPPRWLSRS